MDPLIEKFQIAPLVLRTVVSWNGPQWLYSRTHTPTWPLIDGLSYVRENYFPIFAQITDGCHCPREFSTWTNIFLFSADFGWIPVRLPATHCRNPPERQNDVNEGLKACVARRIQRWRTKRVYLVVRGRKMRMFVMIKRTSAYVEVRLKDKRHVKDDRSRFRYFASTWCRLSAVVFRA